MISNPLTAPADACSPDADRAGPAVPAHIARLLYVIRILLEFGRHLAATMERRAAAPGFWLFSAVFGTTKLPVILAHLHRGILRAAALESLLLKRAAAGRDVAAAPQPAPAEDANADPCNEPFNAQVARLAAERAQHDAPVDPDNLATEEEIEAEIRARPIGRTIADIRRDLGIVAMMCTREFWDSITDAVACYQDSEPLSLEDTPPEPQARPQDQTQESDPLTEHADPRPTLNPRRTPLPRSGNHRVVPFRARPTLAQPRHDVPAPHRHSAAAPAATGPPLRAATKLAA